MDLPTSCDGVAVGPRPVQQPRPPIWLGGMRPGALRRAARWDGWIAIAVADDGSGINLSPDAFGQMVVRVRAERAALGRADGARSTIAVFAYSGPGGGSARGLRGRGRDVVAREPQPDARIARRSPRGRGGRAATASQGACARGVQPRRRMGQTAHDAARAWDELRSAGHPGWRDTDEATSGSATRRARRAPSSSRSPPAAAAHPIRQRAGRRRDRRARRRGERVGSRSWPSSPAPRRRTTSRRRSAAIGLGRASRRSASPPRTCSSRCRCPSTTSPRRRRAATGDERHRPRHRRHEDRVRPDEVQGHPQGDDGQARPDRSTTPTLELRWARWRASSAQTQKLDEDITVVQEGGKWLICD